MCLATLRQQQRAGKQTGVSVDYTEAVLWACSAAVTTVRSWEGSALSGLTELLKWLTEAISKERGTWRHQREEKISDLNAQSKSSMSW